VSGEIRPERRNDAADRLGTIRSAGPSNRDIARAEEKRCGNTCHPTHRPRGFDMTSSTQKTDPEVADRCSNQYYHPAITSASRR